MRVHIKAYGWLEVLAQNGNYSLCRLDSGAKICFNTLGLTFKTDEL